MVVVLAVCLAAVVALAPSAAFGKKLAPEERVFPIAIEISDKAYSYVPLTPDRPLTVRIEGPAIFEAITRWRFEDGDEPVDVEVSVVLDGVAEWRHVFRARPGPATYPEHEGWRAGKPERITLPVSSGPHTIELTLLRPTAGALDVSLLEKPPDVLPWRLHWLGAFGVSYDSNIFRYSDDDVKDFTDGKRPDRYPIDSIDDVRLEPSVNMSWVREEPGKRLTSIGVSADWKLAVVNGRKSFGRFGVRFTEEHFRKAYVTAEYVAIPDYHIRHLWDEDRGEYRSCDFRQQSFRLEIGTDRLYPVDFTGTWRFDGYLYDWDFVEYDAKASTYGIRATVRPAPRVRVDVKYALRQSVARGYDEPGETRSTSDDSDTTYDQDEYSVRVRWGAGRWWGFPAAAYVRARLAKRYYLTKKRGAEDPFHAGREDTYWTLGARASLDLGNGVTLEGFLEHRTRRVKSPVVTDIGRIKDYGVYRVGLKIVLRGVSFLD